MLNGFCGEWRQNVSSLGLGIQIQGVELNAVVPFLIKKLEALSTLRDVCHLSLKLFLAIVAKIGISHILGFGDCAQSNKS